MSRITLLDGGMGQELVHRAGDRPTPLWSTQVMRDHPGLVAQVHADFFAAGATVATANTYAILRDRLTQAGIEAQFAALHDRALHEAETARRAHGAGRIAGAIGPIGASYRPDLHPASDAAVAIYREIAALHIPRVDLILCETVASLAHARDILAATVPGDLLSDLERAGTIGDPLFELNFKDEAQQSLWMQDWAYTRSFALEGSSAAGALVVFDSIKMGARVYVDGALLGTAEVRARPLADVFSRWAASL